MKKIVLLIMLWVFSFGNTLAQQPALKLPDGIPRVFQPKLDSAESFFVAVADADVVIHAVIEQAVEHVTSDAFKEPFSILHLRGTVATADGGEPLPQSYRLRVNSGWASNEVLVNNNEWVFFIKNNRKNYNPIRRSHPVRDGIVYSHTSSTKSIKSIDENGHMKIGKVFFGRALTPDRMIDLAIKYLGKNNIPSPDLTPGLQAVAHNKSLRNENRLDKWNDFSDDIFRRTMDQLSDEQWAMIYTIKPKNDRKMISFVKRELARGKSVHDLHKYAKVVLPFVQKQLNDK